VPTGEAVEGTRKRRRSLSGWPSVPAAAAIWVARHCHVHRGSSGAAPKSYVRPLLLPRAGNSPDARLVSAPMCRAAWRCPQSGTKCYSQRWAWPKCTAVVAITGARSLVTIAMVRNKMTGRQYTGVHKRKPVSLARAKACATVADAGAPGVAKGGAEVVASKAAAGAAAQAMQRRHCIHPKAVALQESVPFESREGLSVPRHCFRRLGRESVVHSRPRLRITAAAVDALQEAAKAYPVEGFEDAVLCGACANHVTVIFKDLALTRRICGERG